MSKIGIACALLFIRFLNFLPRAVINALGSALGLIGYYVATQRRNVGLKNLHLCFPDMTTTQAQKIIKDHFKYLVTSALDYGIVFYGSEKKIRKYIQLKNIENVFKYYGSQPVIILCPHFVGLDLGAIRLSLEVVGYSVYSKQKNDSLTDKLVQARIRFFKDKGGKIFSRQEGLRVIIKQLRETKRVFYYLPDQDFGEKDSIFVPFFAFPTCATVSALPKIVKLTNAVVVPAAVYKKGNGYEMEFFPAWENYPTGDLTQDVIKMNKFVEDVVTKSIAQYFWLHKRFKTQPQGERGQIYKDC
jgi:KDO2-lipid IV(A) lauroyltransferase